MNLMLTLQSAAISLLFIAGCTMIVYDQMLRRRRRREQRLTMRFTPHQCPSCGSNASGVIEKLYCIASLNCDDNGECDYADGSKILWDTQAPEVNDGVVQLTCTCGTNWAAEQHD